MDLSKKMLPIFMHCKQNLSRYILRDYNTVPFNYTSKIFQPSLGNCIPSTGVNAAQLLVYHGYMQQSSPGLYTLLPLAQRALAKLSALVDEEMQAIGAQKIVLPTLTSSHLWQKTGRLQEIGPELMTVGDRHNKMYVLSPTHEEAICDVLSHGIGVSQSQLPLLLYQVTSKFRDEGRPRHALLRSREFLMKDLYSFDKDEELTAATYELVAGAYHRILTRIGLPFTKARGSCGTVGGQSSHEYHYLADTGQDRVLKCSCGYAVSSTLLEEEGGDEHRCPDCGGDMTGHVGIEIGHTFVLGCRYSAALKAVYHGSNNSTQPLHMGCYGLGLSRLVQAAVDVARGQGGEGIVWPWLLAPFKVCIIGPKEGSKEIAALSWVLALASHISSLVPGVSPQDVLLDDRSGMTIGRRVAEARDTGYPLVVVVGRPALDAVPKFELIDNTRRFRDIAGMSHVAAVDVHEGKKKSGILLTQLQLLNVLNELCSVMQR